MRVLKKAIAGLLLLIGLPVLILTTADIVNPESSQEDKSNATAALVLLGLPPSLLGTWLMAGLWTAAHRRDRDRLRTSFFTLVKQGRGRISAFDFANATGLSGDRARAYLDERARTFNATFHVSEDGGIFYRFILGYADTQQLLDDANSMAEGQNGLEANATAGTVDRTVDRAVDRAVDRVIVDDAADNTATSDHVSHGAHPPEPMQPHDNRQPYDKGQTVTYDILLREVPGDRQAEVVQAMQNLSRQQDESSVRQIMSQPLGLIVSGVDLTTAERYRQQLKQLGVTVLVVLPDALEVKESRLNAPSQDESGTATEAASKPAAADDPKP